MKKMLSGTLFCFIISDLFLKDNVWRVPTPGRLAYDTRGDAV
jgi:hypothetical protein